MRITLLLSCLTVLLPGQALATPSGADFAGSAAAVPTDLAANLEVTNAFGSLQPGLRAPAVSLEDSTHVAVSGVLPASLDLANFDSATAFVAFSDFRTGSRVVSADLTTLTDTSDLTFDLFAAPAWLALSAANRPEPGGVLLLGAGLIGLFAGRRTGRLSEA